MISPTRICRELGRAIAKDVAIKAFCEEKYGRELGVWLGKVDDGYFDRRDADAPRPHPFVEIAPFENIEGGNERTFDVAKIVVAVCVESRTKLAGGVPEKDGDGVFSYLFDEDLEVLYGMIIGVAQSSEVTAISRTWTVKSDTFSDYPICEAVMEGEFYGNPNAF